jgi:putative ABC transport system permease protein
MLLQDVRYALRMLRKRPAFTGAAVLTIALGIAANTRIFSVVNVAMIRSLPFAEPDRLMQVAERNEKLNIAYFSASALNYLSWKEQTRTFEQLGAFGFATYTLTGRGEPEQVTGGPISPSLVPLLGLRPVAGRTFCEGEDKPGSPPVVMISSTLWKRRFAGERAVIDQPLMVNGTVYTLVGVMGPELNLLTGGDLWVPMLIDQTRENRLKGSRANA